MAGGVVIIPRDCGMV